MRMTKNSTEQATFRKDISENKGSLANTLSVFIPTMQTYPDRDTLYNTVMAAVKETIDNGISDKTYKKFSGAMAKSRTKDEVMYTITQFYLAGCGLGLGRGLAEKKRGKKNDNEEDQD